MLRPISLLAGLALLAGCSSTPSTKADTPLAATATAQASTQDTSIAAQNLLALRIITRAATHDFRVEVARTAAEQEKGLMFRQSLPVNGGMLFPLTPPRSASFWMKNTYIPLDILFINADGTIANIAVNTTPFSLEAVSSANSVAAVLELAGGTTTRLGIRAGDKVLWADR